MNVLRLKPNQLMEGDILIIEHDNFIADERISLSGSKRDFNKFGKKQEGESGFLLYEIDDIDIFFKDTENKEGNIYEFYHMDEIIGRGMVSITCLDEEYLFDVICNPNYNINNRPEIITPKE